MKFPFFDTWAWRMSWRESRSSHKRLLLFVSSIVLGVAALVAIMSFAANLQRSIGTHAKLLLGADLVLRSRSSYTSDVEELIQSLGGEQSREVRLTSMLYFPKSDQTRLAQIRAIEGDFPFYGRLDTSPRDAAETFREGGPFALVDRGLMFQFEAEPGDPVRIGDFTFTIAGSLLNIPGESLSESLIAPRVYISRTYLEQTGLVQFGSRVNYRTYFRFEPPRDVETLVEGLEPVLRKHRLRTDTVEERKEDLGRSIDNLSLFLNLTSLAALLLGGIGVASAIHVYIRQRVSTVATLRCLGATSSQAFSIYLVQVLVMGFLAAGLGAVLGIGFLKLLPGVLSDFLPLRISSQVLWEPILIGLLFGLGVALLFALLPLVGIRRVSPLFALRFSYEQETEDHDFLQWSLYVVIAALITTFALTQARDWTEGFAFAGAILSVFVLLFLVARLLTLGVRRFFPRGWSYVWRQGLANLYRPNNQTTVMMMAIGLGTFLISTLLLTQSSLLEQVLELTSESKPNMVLFDIQTDQRQEILDGLNDFNLPVLQDVPIVTMRLASVNGRPVEAIAADPDSTIREWALFREYRCTYRDRVIDSETLIAGTWQAHVQNPSDPVYVSLYEGIAEDLEVSLGDRLVFNVQGLPVETIVGSLREIDWRRIQPNFFVVFPTGVLEEAPQFHVVVTRTDSAEISAELQRAVVKRFPNVSIIDLQLVLNTIDEVLDRVAFVLRFMALFSIVTGLIVLVGAMISSRYQRLKESVLLRTLGASRRQVSSILAIEYLFLGLFAALTGLILAVLASWGLVHFIFETQFTLGIVPILMVLAAVMGLTLLIGMLNSRGLYNYPPLEILRMSND